VLKIRQSELEFRNMREQLDADVQYKAMFGGEELEIKRHYRVKKPPSTLQILDENNMPTL
jgi:hypothetical protein